MASITENKNRIGNFTSSSIWKLMKTGKQEGGFGVPAITYIQEKVWERKLKRSINTDTSTRPMLWGKFLEKRVHELLPLNYKHVYDETILHPKHPYWAGSPDNDDEQAKAVGDTKCPQPKAFCELVDVLTRAVETNDISHFRDHDDGKYYWQVTSNACIKGYDYIELTLYLPYESELRDIRMAAENWDGEDQFKYRWIYECDRSELAYQPDNSEYKNLYSFRFPLVLADAIMLEQNVIKAAKILNAAK